MFIGKIMHVQIQDRRSILKYEVLEALIKTTTAHITSFTIEKCYFIANQ